MTSLPQPLVDAVLRALGLERPSPDFDGLWRLYRRWCERVPFDNSRKLAHIGAGNPAPLPGDRPEDFFRAWLEHGAGGTCWSGNGALCELLRALGFDALRGVATMLVADDASPNHGTVAVDLEEGRFLVDASMLHREPLLLAEKPTSIEHFAWGVEARRDEHGKTRVRWHPFHLDDGLDCRLEAFGASAADFRERHEATRAWSPFNYALSLRLIRGESMVGFRYGKYGERTAAGGTIHEERATPWRRRFLAETIGFSPQLIARIPPDREIPARAWRG